MSYILKPDRKPILAGGNLRIYNILKDELKMDASTARELWAEMDAVLNDRLQDIIQYAKTLGETNEKSIQTEADQIRRRLNERDKSITEKNEYFRNELHKMDMRLDEELWFWGRGTWRIIYWVLILGVPVTLFLVDLAGKLKK
ncbi:hypothetical protein ACTJJB_30120 [Chitinophaga sp. 22536]|uniref:hypothetical protein n=1 Tax=unclassified Chitinophaga TaxID=2619133 RepID=UPI003F85C375